MKEESGKFSDVPAVEWKVYLDIYKHEKTVFLTESPKFTSSQVFVGTKMGLI